MQLEASHQIRPEMTIQCVTMTQCQMVAHGVAMGFEVGPDWTTHGGLPRLFLIDPAATKPFLASVGRMPQTRHEPAHYVLTLAPELTGHAQPHQRKFATRLASEYALIAAGAAYAGKQTGLLAA